MAMPGTSFHKHALSYVAGFIAAAIATLAHAQMQINCTSIINLNSGTGKLGLQARASLITRNGGNNIQLEEALRMAPSIKLKYL